MEGTCILILALSCWLYPVRGSRPASNLPIMWDNFSHGVRQLDLGWFLSLGAEGILIYSDVEMGARYTGRGMC